MDPATKRSAAAVTSIARPEDHVIVLFGATGDLAKRKLLPGLFRLASAGLLPEHYRIIGSAPVRSALSGAEFRKHAREAVTKFGSGEPEAGAWREFESSLDFGAADPEDASALLAAVERAEKEIGGTPRRIFHLAVPPVAFGSVIKMLGATNLNRGGSVIVEKPFGTDLASARALNKTIHDVFDEAQVFRIDHFLGKESVDNILALRFANGIFEPIWNREHISYVQIDVPETLSIEGRSSFYEGTGAFRDMIITHLFQVLGFVAMEPPTSLGAKALRDEKIKVFEAMPPIDPAHVVRGQYKGYRAEPGVTADSQTETFVALRAEVDNWRWAGVPFCLRTGKGLGASRQVVTLGFRQPPLRMFPIDSRNARSGHGNELVIDFKDPGSITAQFLAKEPNGLALSRFSVIYATPLCVITQRSPVQGSCAIQEHLCLTRPYVSKARTLAKEPGPQMRLGQAEMAFHYGNSFRAANGLEGYEHLLLNAMLGDQALFTRADGIERLWEISTPLLDNPPAVEPYAPGSWGPASVHRIAAPYRWRIPEN